MALISDIPTITAAQAAALESVGLFTLDDLLRTERGALVRRLPQLTITRFRGWQAIAELSQLDTITVAEAAALHAAGADGIDEFSGWGLARLRPILAQRDDEQLMALAKDAVRLRHTGVVNGNVRLRDETPVEGALVTVAGRNAVTDARGRFRVVGLALGDRVAVAATHPRLGHKLLTTVPVRRSGALVAVTLVLGGRPRSPRKYSQRRGDTLPPLGSSVITTRVEPTPPESDDLLVIAGRYSGGDYRVASEFLDFEDGVFLRRLYRLPAGSVPATAVVGDGLGWRAGAWTVRKHCARDVARRVRLRAAARRISGPPGSDAEASAQARALLAAASDR